MSDLLVIAERKEMKSTQVHSNYLERQGSYP